MISNILKTLQSGFGVMRSNSRMLLVGILVFVFPLIFVLVTQSFFSTSYSNIQTSNDNRVSTIHASAKIILAQPELTTVNLNSAIEKIVQVNQDVQVFRIYTETGSEFTVMASEATELIGQVVSVPRLITDVGFTEKRNFIRTEFLADGDRVWQVASKVLINDTNYYIFTEHNFSTVDSVMSARRQQSYFGLTAIFVFLIALAYWINKQTDWRKKHYKLENDLKERDMFSNMIAHEFRTPLTAIKGYASFLEESKDIKQEEARFVQNIRVSTERLILLVNDFLEVARLQSGKMVIESRLVTINSVFTLITNDLQKVAEKKGLTLNYIEVPEKVVLLSDKKRMIQVLTNIVSNAIKYTETGSVTLECEDKQNELIIYVKDTGTGISADDQRKLFLPFSRVGGVDSTAITGSGLGMWITKQLVAFLNGRIGVESIKGVGTHVVITFKKD